MRVLVIGGTGFIGAPVVARLVAGGHDVAVLHRGVREAHLPSEVASILGDRRRLSSHRDDVVAFAPDVVVDVVLSSGRQAAELMATLRGVAHRVVALSSMDVYRACGVLHGLEDGPIEPVPLTEDSALRTKPPYPPDQVRQLQTVYGWLDDDYDKIPVERAVLGSRSLSGTVLRLPMVYGPGDPLRRLQPILDPIAQGRPAIVMSEGMAGWRAPRGYVENVAEAVARAVESEKAAGRVYNVADREFFTELEWTRRVAAVVGWNGAVEVLADDVASPELRPPGNTAQHWIADTSRIRRELGYREVVDVDEAIRRTAAWMRANPAR